MDKRILELALEALEHKKALVESEIAALQVELEGGAKPATEAPTRGGRKPRTAAQRKAQSEKMKAHWAKWKAKKARTERRFA